MAVQQPGRAQGPQYTEIDVRDVNDAPEGKHFAVHIARGGPNAPEPVEGGLKEVREAMDAGRGDEYVVAVEGDEPYLGDLDGFENVYGEEPPMPERGRIPFDEGALPEPHEGSRGRNVYSVRAYMDDGGDIPFHRLRVHEEDPVYLQ